MQLSRGFLIVLWAASAAIAAPTQKRQSTECDYALSTLEQARAIIEGSEGDVQRILEGFDSGYQEVSQACSDYVTMVIENETTVDESSLDAIS